VIAEWLANGRTLPSEKEEPTTELETVGSIVAAYAAFAETYYRGPDGRLTSEFQNVVDALEHVLKLYEDTPALEFGPLALRAVQRDMITCGKLARKTINARANRIRRAFRWAVSVQKLPGTLIHELATVPPLARGRSEARETDPVLPVARETVEATLPELNPTVRDMVRVQLLTGCRPNEIIIMRTCDLKIGEETWEYRPATHKTSWRGKDRVIYIGPRAQEILKKFLKFDHHAYMFDPSDLLTGRIKKKSRRYSRTTYRQAIVRACDRAFPHPTLAKIPAAKLTADQRQELAAWKKSNHWCPLQLRHSHATAVRLAYGLEGAQVALGHSHADVTQIYAERDMSLAYRIAAEIG
jgi:integrase